MNKKILDKKHITSTWFRDLRDLICSSYEDIEKEYYPFKSAKFHRKKWDRNGGGGGEMSIMRGRVFEKVGVNISMVEGQFSSQFALEIPGAEKDRNFFATGISLVAHPKSPLVPMVHFNTRYIQTSKFWFGGGADLTPVFVDTLETNAFHESFKEVCNKFNDSYYDKFKKQCDEYFYIKHRKEPRGVGGIFFDYLNTESFEDDFSFVKEVGVCMKNIYPTIVKRKMFEKWNKDQKKAQLIKRGRYAEFNLVYDRGTRFGFMTEGNTEAILMSMPPTASWP